MAVGRGNIVMEVTIGIVMGITNMDITDMGITNMDITDMGITNMDTINTDTIERIARQGRSTRVRVIGKETR